MSSKYNYPPGLDRNLLFYFFTKFRPGDPIRFFEHLVRTYGDAASYKIGPNRIVFFNHPDLIREVLVNKAGSFHKERTQDRMKILLGNGLITSEEPVHRRQRLMAQPAFHRVRIAGYARHMVEMAQQRRAEWTKRTERGATEIDMHDEMMELTLSVVAITLFNTEVNAQVRAINDEVNAVMRLYNFLVALPQRARWLLELPVPGAARFRRARSRLNDVINGMIEEHRRSGDKEAADPDLLSMLLSARYEDGSAMSDEQLRDEVMTIFLAGYETMANALTWTWYLLAENPQAESRLQAEIDHVLGQGEGARIAKIDDLPRLRYVEQVLAESMRLYPPAWAMGRRAIEDVDIGAWRIERGAYIYFSQYVLQRTDKYWPDPLRFDPERFAREAEPEDERVAGARAAAQRSEAARKEARHPFIYFPFGGGPRKCIGESFAWTEGVLLLSTLAQRFRARIAPGFTPTLYPSVTLRPRHGMKMILERR